MCYRPLRIINPCKNPTFRDKLFLTVPCGKCKQCRDRKQNDFGVRAYFEGLNTHKKYNGLVLFCTFTINPINIKYDENGFAIFDKKDVQNYLKILRKRLGYDTLRYIWCAEYGETSNLPHYHAILYYNKPCTGSDYFHIISLIKKEWQGLPDWQVPKEKQYLLKRGIAKIEPISTFKGYFYVSKYINKQIATFDKDVPSYAQPFHLQSKGLGLSILQYIGYTPGSNNCEILQKFFDGEILELPDNLKYICDGKFPTPYGRISALPQYISKKLLYDYEVSKVENEIESDLIQKKVKVKWHLNEFGEYVLKYRSYRTISQTYKEIKNYLTPQNINTLNIYETNSYLHSCFENTSEICEFVKTVLYDDARISSLALYLSTFKDRVIIPYGNDYIYSPFTPACPEKDSFYLPSVSDAFSYINTLFSHDIEYYDINPKFVKHEAKFLSFSRFQNYIDVVSTRLYNQFFPIEFDLLSNLLNYIIYVHRETMQKVYENKDLFNYQSKQLQQKII